MVILGGWALYYERGTPVVLSSLETSMPKSAGARGARQLSLSLEDQAPLRLDGGGRTTQR